MGNITPLVLSNPIRHSGILSFHWDKKGLSNTFIKEASQQIQSRLSFTEQWFIMDKYPNRSPKKIVIDELILQLCLYCFCKLKKKFISGLKVFAIFILNSVEFQENFQEQYNKCMYLFHPDSGMTSCHICEHSLHIHKYNFLFFFLNRLRISCRH